MRAYTPSRYGALAAIFLTVFMFSCEKDKEPDKGIMEFKIDYRVDSEALEMGKIQYQNAAGNQYSVTNLKYYISDLKFHSEGGTTHHDRTVHYVDAEKSASNTLRATGIPPGSYTGISFHIGLNEQMNKSNGLPATIDNINMGWPDPMGGGYHFLKLEGRFMDGAGDSKGYAMHLGTDTCLIQLSIAHPFVVTNQTGQLNLSMNINEWFSTPNTYDLNSANYIMGNGPQMIKIAQNGSDVFTID